MGQCTPTTYFIIAFDWQKFSLISSIRLNKIEIEKRPSCDVPVYDTTITDDKIENYTNRNHFFVMSGW